MRISTTVFGLVLLLSACGGGDSGSSRPGQPNESEVVIPLQPEVKITEFQSQDGTSRETVARYMRDAVEGSVIRHRSAPTLRFAVSTDLIRRNYTERAVRMINSALPPQHRIRIGSDVPDRTQDIPNGEIFVDFVSERDFQWRGRAVAQRVLFDKEPTNPRFSTHIWVDKDNFENSIAHNLNRDEMTRIMIHEILHALGMTSHVEGVGTSVMNSRVNRREFLYPIDKDGLLALYLLDVDDLPSEFGPWNETSMNISGELDGIRFGVRSYNGGVTPWAEGNEPGTLLAGTHRIIDGPEIARHLSGPVTWRGSLVGHTLETEAVTSDAELEVYIPTSVRRGNLTGNLRFNDMEYRSSGVQWGPGALAFEVNVTGNSFVWSSGPNAGVINGKFYGERHEVMGGTLERSDLTAAFGGRR